MTENHPAGPIPRTPREEVRRRLLTEATRVFAEQGYADSGLEEIAHAAGFTKGAVYSNFGSKQGLFGAVLSDLSDGELSTVMAGIHDTGDPAEMVALAARLVARRIVDDTERGRLGLEFAARAARDARTREVLTPIRREQRAAAARSIGEVVERTGASPAADVDLVALILHCLTNGLANEHAADPEAITAEVAERVLSTVIAALVPLPPKA